MLPDTHAHLDAIDDLEDAIVRAVAAGVSPILAVGSNLETSLSAVEAARQYEAVYAAVGVHPHEASHFEEERERVRALLAEEKVVAVGEIGLDYYRMRAPREVQWDAFREQLTWARERDLPVSVHNREADRDILRALEDSRVRAVLHCFSGDWETAQAGLRLGCSISFAGNVTYRNAADLREIASRVPGERLLIESDAPVLAPQPRRGKRNEPAFVTITAHVLAAARGVAFADLASSVSENAAGVFGWSAG